MPKLKTHSASKKRFSLTKSGKVKRAHAYKSHLLNGHGRDRITGINGKSPFHAELLHAKIGIFQRSAYQKSFCFFEHILSDPFVHSFSCSD